MWKEELPKKFASWMLYSVCWAKEHIARDEHTAQVGPIKAGSIGKFAAGCDGVIAGLQDTLRAWEAAEKAEGTRFHKYPFALGKGDLQVVIFAMREYLTFLNYEDRKFDRYVEEDWDSDDRLSVGEDQGYVSACVISLENIYEELFGSEFFDW